MSNLSVSTYLLKIKVILSRYTPVLQPSCSILAPGCLDGFAMRFQELFEAACVFQNLYQVFALLDSRATPVLQTRTVSKGINFINIPQTWLDCFMTLVGTTHVCSLVTLLLYEICSSIHSVWQRTVINRGSTDLKAQVKTIVQMTGFSLQAF